MFRSLRTLETKVQQLMEKQEKKQEKERAKFSQEMGAKPEPKKAKAITPSQILERFKQMPVRQARPQLVFELVYCLDESEAAELKALIEAAAQTRTAMKEPPKYEMPTKPVGRLPSKSKRPISAKQISERFQQMKSNRPQLVFDLSECLTPRERQTVDKLIDSALRVSLMSRSNE